MSWKQILLLAAVSSFGMVAVPKEQNDKDAIRHMATGEAMRRPNQGEVTALHDFWDQNADSSRTRT